MSLLIYKQIILALLHAPGHFDLKSLGFRQALQYAQHVFQGKGLRPDVSWQTCTCTGCLNISRCPQQLQAVAQGLAATAERLLYLQERQAACLTLRNSGMRENRGHTAARKVASGIAGQASGGRSTNSTMAPSTLGLG